MSKKIVVTVVIFLLTLTSFFIFREEVYFNLGNYYFGGSKYDLKKANNYFHKLYSLDRNYPRLNYQLSRIDFLNGRFESAISRIDKEIELYPDFYKSYYMKGLIAGYQKDFETSINSFKKFQEYDDFNWAAYNDLSWVYFQKGDFVMAKEVALKGLEKAQNNPWLNNSLGIALLNLKDFNSAQIAFEKALADIEGIGKEAWGKAYPGNDPRIYEKGYEATKEAIVYNLEIIKNKQ